MIYRIASSPEIITLVANFKMWENYSKKSDNKVHCSMFMLTEVEMLKKHLNWWQVLNS